VELVKPIDQLRDQTVRSIMERTKKALAETLGYESFEALLAASQGHDRGAV
jgi:hypothetical protein